MRLKQIAATVQMPGVSDIIRTLMYRSDLFGAPFSEAVHQALRGPSDWRVGERELFAAFVSYQNHCPF